MGVKYIAIMGFGYSGSTAFADTLLPYKQFESIQDYEEINELRGPDSLIKKFKIYKSAQKKEKILAQFLLVSFIRLVRRFVWGFRKSIFIRNGLSWRRKFGNNIKRLRCDINYIRCILWFRKASVTADVEDLIRIYLIGLRISCKVKVDQTLILNQISFPEHPTRAILSSFPDDLKILVTTRNAFDCICDMESNGSYFISNDLSQDFILGADEDGQLRRRNYIQVLKHRAQAVSDLLSNFPDKVSVVSFSSLVNSFDGTFKDLIRFCGLDDEILLHDSAKNGERFFNPELSKKNLFDLKDSIERLRSFGYTDKLLAELAELDEMYVSLEAKSFSNHDLNRDS